MTEYENRLERQRAFAEKNGWAGADLYPLAADASFRTYTRLVMGERSCLLMDAPPDHENIDAYLDITNHLRGLGLRVPTVFAEDRASGFALLEDFGDATFTRLLKEGVDEQSLYFLAVDVLKALHQHPRATAIPLPTYDMDELLREVALLKDWFAPKVMGRDLSEVEAAQLEGAWRDALDGVANDRSALVLKDYHVDNLMVVDGETALERCALLDYQDALLGSPAYDLVSLLEDARRDITPETRRAALARYFEGQEGVDRLRMLEQMSILGAQRHAKVLGIFVRLSERDGKPVYLEHLPRVQKLFIRSLSNPKLKALKDIIFTLMPDIGSVSHQFG